MQKMTIAILTITLLTMSIGMATAVPMIYDISYDPTTSETYITNNETSQSALLLYGHNNDEIVGQMWLSPGDSITFYEDGTHSPYTEGTTKDRFINNKDKEYTVTGWGFQYKELIDGKWTDWKTPGASGIVIPEHSHCYWIKKTGWICGFLVRGCSIETISEDTDILINPDERPSYLPADQALIQLLSGGIRVETDTDEFMSVMTKSSGSGNSGGVHAGCIPEFPTIVLPVISIIGLMFLFQRRKGE